MYQDPNIHMWSIGCCMSILHFGCPMWASRVNIKKDPLLSIWDLFVWYLISSPNLGFRSNPHGFHQIRFRIPILASTCSKFLKELAAKTPHHVHPNWFAQAELSATWDVADQQQGHRAEQAALQQGPLQGVRSRSALPVKSQMPANLQCFD